MWEVWGNLISAMIGAAGCGALIGIVVNHFNQKRITGIIDHYQTKIEELNAANNNTAIRVMQEVGNIMDQIQELRKAG